MAPCPKQLPPNIVAEFVRHTVLSEAPHNSAKDTVIFKNNITIATSVFLANGWLSSFVAADIQRGVFDALFAQAYDQYSEAQAVRDALVNNYNYGTALHVRPHAKFDGMGTAIADHLTGHITRNILLSLQEYGLLAEDQYAVLNIIASSAIGRMHGLREAGVKAIDPRVLFLPAEYRNAKKLISLVEESYCAMPDIEANIRALMKNTTPKKTIE